MAHLHLTPEYIAEMDTVLFKIGEGRNVLDFAFTYDELIGLRDFIQEGLDAIASVGEKSGWSHEKDYEDGGEGPSRLFLKHWKEDFPKGFEDDSV